MSDATQIKGMGAVPHAGGVAFRVWAPHAQCVSVIGSFKTSLLESRGHSTAPNHRIAPLYAKARGERFERVFFTDLQRVCADKEVQILRDVVRKIRVLEEISKPIRDAAIAKQELPRNQQEGLHADGAAETLEAEAKIKQHKQQIDAETAKKVVETQAQQRLAEVNLQTAKKEVATTLTLGKRAPYMAVRHRGVMYFHGRQPNCEVPSCKRSVSPLRVVFMRRSRSGRVSILRQNNCLKPATGGCS